jgi:hypothetical protein
MTTARPIVSIQSRTSQINDKLYDFFRYKQTDKRTDNCGWIKASDEASAHIVVHIDETLGELASSSDPRIHVYVTSRPDQDQDGEALSRVTTWSSYAHVRDINDISEVGTQVKEIATQLIRNYLNSHLILKTQQHCQEALRNKHEALNEAIWGKRINKKPQGGGTASLAQELKDLPALLSGLSYETVASAIAQV